MNFETDAVEWVPVPAVEARPLHAGFAAAWPAIRRIIEDRCRPVRPGDSAG